MAKINMVQAINEAIKSEMARDKKVLIMGEDVGVDGGVFRVTDGLSTQFGPNRVIDTPLAEAGIIGTAVGLAINGMKPIVEMQFIGFSYEGFHHINHHVGRMRQRSEGSVSCPIVLRGPSGGGIKALELHSESPETFFIHSQGIKVICPSNPYDAKGLMISAIRDPDPVIFLEPEKLYRSFKDEVPEESFTVPIGEAKVVRTGKDVTIVSWGAMVRLCLDVAEQLKDKVDIEIIDLRTLWPLDEDKIIESVKKTGRAVIVHEAPRTGGYGGEIASRIQEKGILYLQSPVIRVTGFDVPYPQFALEEYYLPNAERVIKGINSVMNF
ncbi:MAG TPA: alpha-ketoacid dehydrogenase subunit beta [Alphaproteobacteria bacterium]|nr:alpha-ketoacid dehydrogenase subunit beta [Alphaproteobacteria bacterium]